MENTIVNKVLSIDIKVLTNDNKESIIRYTDFKYLEDVTISQEYKEDYSNNVCFNKSLENIGFDIKCKGYSVEIIEV